MHDSLIAAQLAKQSSEEIDENELYGTAAMPGAIKSMT